MMAGQLFTMYVQDSPAGATPVTGHIEADTLVWYVPSSENGLSTGAFYYAPSKLGKDGRDESKKVALKFLTDVFVGQWESTRDSEAAQRRLIAPRVLTVTRLRLRPFPSLRDPAWEWRPSPLCSVPCACVRSPGKQTPILLSPLAAAVDENNVMTFVSASCELNLECKESAETIEAWLEG